MNEFVRPSEAIAAAAPVISVKDLKVSFSRADGSRFSVVDGVSFDIKPGEIVGIVGESGSGKSMTARSILRLVPKSGELEGEILFQGKNIFDLPAAAVRAIRGAAIAMIFQDPMTSFNPVLRIGDQIEEAMAIHRHASKKSLWTRVVDLLSRVGIANAAERARAYPHEFSGGMRQRALTAMALANDPALLIADEPTTALDVSVQDQVMDLMRDLNTRSGTTILLITHNIAVVSSLCSRVVVMYAGRVVEDGPTEKVLSDPQHPYTWSLLQSMPRIDRAAKRLTAIKGQPPDAAALPDGCKFHPRCPFAIARCAQEEPPLTAVSDGESSARCFVLMRNVPEAAR